ncbi:MAG: hypothetical protein JXX28_01175 [Deltaproteobacteria bacterium]|nr:hypothetical protein [Deltaproteobacteria bacterium]
MSERSLRALTLISLELKHVEAQLVEEARLIARTGEHRADALRALLDQRDRHLQRLGEALLTALAAHGTLSLRQGENGLLDGVPEARDATTPAQPPVEGRTWHGAVRGAASPPATAPAPGAGAPAPGQRPASTPPAAPDARASRDEHRAPPLAQRESTPEPGATTERAVRIAGPSGELVHGGGDLPPAPRATLLDAPQPHEPPGQDLPPEPAAPAKHAVPADTAPTERRAPVERAVLIAPPMRTSPPPSAPASTASLQELVTRGMTGTGAPPPPAPHPLFQPTRPAAPTDRASLAEAVEQFLRMVQERDLWPDHPQEVQRRSLALTVHLGRHLQDHLPTSGARDLARAIDSAFPTLTEWSATHRPGSVWGLALDHRPTQGSWLAEAQASWDALFSQPERRAPTEPLIANLRRDLPALKPADLRSRLLHALQGGVSPQDTQLLNLLADHYDHLKAEPKLKPLRKHLQRHLKTQHRAASAPAAPQLSALAEHTRGKRVLMVGGDRRQDAQERLQSAFAFDHLHWDSGWDTARIDAAAERLKGGTVDLLLIIQGFVKHLATNKLVATAKASGVPFASVEHGYGVRQVEQALQPLFD